MLAPKSIQTLARLKNKVSQKLNFSHFVGVKGEEGGPQTNPAQSVSPLLDSPSITTLGEAPTFPNSLLD